MEQSPESNLGLSRYVSILGKRADIILTAMTAAVLAGILLSVITTESSEDYKRPSAQLWFISLTGERPSREFLLIDDNSMTVDGDEITFWIIQKKEDEPWQNRVMFEMGFNCEERLIRYISPIIKYEGEETFEENFLEEDERWRSYPESTVPSSFLKFACGEYEPWFVGMGPDRPATFIKYYSLIGSAYSQDRESQ